MMSRRKILFEIYENGIIMKRVHKLMSINFVDSRPVNSIE